MQQFKIRVIPNARKNEIICEGETIKVKVNAPAVDGKANKAVIEALCDFWDLKKSEIEIVKGELSRDKTIQINSNKEIHFSHDKKN